MKKEAKPCQSSASRADMPREYYQLHALLQTLRCLDTCEDDICGLLAEIERVGQVKARVRGDIRRLLGELHLHALNEEVRALCASVEERAA